MRYPSWIQIAVLFVLLAGAIAAAWIQLRPEPETKTRRLRLVKSPDGAAEGRSLGPTLRTRDKIQQTRIRGQRRGA